MTGPGGLLYNSSPLGLKEVLRRCSGLQATSQTAGPQALADGSPEPGPRRSLAALHHSRDPLGAFSRLAARLQLAPVNAGARGGGGGGGASSRAAPLLSHHQGRQAEDGDEAAAAAVVTEMLGSEGAVRDAVVAAMCALSRAFMLDLNSTTVHNEARLRAALDRPEGTPLITACNHVSLLDDPVLMGALVPRDVAAEPRRLRWGMCAADRCFNKGRLAEAFCRAGKVLRTERGAGLDQPAMWAAEGRLRAGDWLHVFPEGTRSRDGGRTLGRARRGVGRLVVSCPRPPVVLPFVHRGMEAIMPRGQALPRLGQQVDVLFGEPVPVDDLWRAFHCGRLPEDECYALAAARIQLALAKLKAELDGADGQTCMDQGVAPGIFGELGEPSHNKWAWPWAWRAPMTLGAAAAAAAGAPPTPAPAAAAASSLDGWGRTLLESARLLGLDLSSAAASGSLQLQHPAHHQDPLPRGQGQGCYSMQRGQEMLRILSAAG